MQKATALTRLPVSSSNAEHIGSKGHTLAAPGGAPPVQMTGEKSKKSMAKKYAGQGAVYGAGFAPVLSGGNKAVTGQEQGGLRENGLLAAGGALVGGLIGGIYGYTQGYATFSNQQKNFYTEELSNYHEWQKQQDEGISAYKSGEIFEYNDTNADTIHEMLNYGKVMYAYDTDERLRVSGKHESIKHALLAEGKDVYSAGNAELEYTGRKRDIASAIQQVSIIDGLKSKLEFYETGDDDYQNNPRYKGALELTNQARHKLESLDFAVDVTSEELNELLLDTTIEKVESTLLVDNDSGHYAPTYSAGHMGLKAWSDAGYKHIKWKSVRGAPKRFYHAQVNDIDNR